MKGVPMSTKLYVGNLSFKMDESQIRDLFQPFGDVTDLHIPTEMGSGRPRGFAFVTFANAESAQKAIQALDGQEVEGRNLTVNEARPKEDRGGGGGGGGRREGRGSFQQRNRY